MARRWPVFLDPDWYLAVYPDVALAARDPRRHYLRHGRGEGRLPTALRSVWQERDLRWGVLDGGRAALEDLARTATGAEAVWARIACARASARQEDWAAAAEWLAPLDPVDDIVEGFALLDPALIGAETALRTGDAPRAQIIWAAARRRFGRHTDLALIRANITGATKGLGGDWRRAMARVYRRNWLVGVRIEDGTGAAIDRLKPTSTGTARSGPLVSVIVPARDAALTLRTALRSLTVQTWQTLEILVVENGSSDATRGVAHQAAAQDPRIRVIPAPEARNTYDARNLGMEQARGAYLTVLDADDWAHPQRIARQVAALRAAPQAAGALCDWVRVTPDMQFSRWWRDDGLVHPDISSLMLRREAREALGYWDRVLVGADSEYLDRLRARFGQDAVLQVLPSVPLGFGRLRPDSLTGRAETSIQSHVYGTRRTYALAAQRWHARTPDPHLDRLPATRPFPAPAAQASPVPVAPLADEERLAEAGIYDDAWYMRSHADLRAGNVDGLTHYVRTGAQEGRNPGPEFSTTGYALRRGLDPAEAWQAALHDPTGAREDWLPSWDGERPRQPGQPHAMVFAHRAGRHLFGVERVLPQVLDRAAEEGSAVSVTLPEILAPDYLDQLRGLCHRVHLRPYGWHFDGVRPAARTLDQLTELLRDEAVTEVHQMTCVLDAPLLAARRAGVPGVLHLHETPASDPRLCMDLGTTPDALRQHITGLADRIVAVSPTCADWIAAPDRTQLWSNSAPASLADLPFAPEDPVRVALIGSLTARKGVGDFIELARAAQRAGTRARFVMIGPMSEMLQRVQSWPDLLFHEGYADGPAEALAKADIVVNLSHFTESHGLSVHEALVAGRPVIVHDQPALRGLVGDSPAGAVVPQGDTRAVLAALQGMLSPGRLHQASAAARSRGAELQALARIGRASIFGQHLDPR